MSPRPEVPSPSSYPPSYPPQLGPPRQQGLQQRYPYHQQQHQELSASSSASRTQLPPQGYLPIHHQRHTQSPPGEFRPGSPPYHPHHGGSRNTSRGGGGGDRRRFIHLNESSSSPSSHYYDQPPPPSRYYRASGYQQQQQQQKKHEEERYILEKENSSRSVVNMSKDPYKDSHISLEHSLSPSSSHHRQHSSSGYRSQTQQQQQQRHHATEHLARLAARSEEKDYAMTRDEVNEEYATERSQEKYRLQAQSSNNQIHSPVEYIQPREREEDSYRMEERERAGASRNNLYPSSSLSVPKRENEDHMALFRGKPSISYGDYSTAPSASGKGGVEVAPSSSSIVPRGEGVNVYYRGGDKRRQRPSVGSSDPGDVISMTAAPTEDIEPEDEKDTALIEPRTSSSLTPQPLLVDNDDTAVDSPVNVYVDDEEIPIVTPSDDTTLTTAAIAGASPANDVTTSSFEQNTDSS